MPIYQFRCRTCSTVHEDLVPMGQDTHTCPACGHTAEQVILSAPKLDTWNLAIHGVSPESKMKLNRMLKGRREKEERSLREHGDYGASTGYKTPPSE